MNTTVLQKPNTITSFRNNKPVKPVTKVVVVEDDESILELIYFALKKKGYEVKTYNNALPALDNINIDKPDIVISDIMMPGMDGIEFCKHVKNAHKEIYFIILTAKDTIEDKVEGLDMGADEYITKPFDFMELIARVKAAERIIENQKQLVYLNEKLEKLADTDELTRLKNRRYFQNEVPKEIERSSRYGHTVSIIMLDIDNFKIINDNEGHQAGDKALQAVSQIIKNSTRESDIICRYGGEEFVVFLPETNPKNAFKVAEKIRRNIEKTDANFIGLSKPLTVSAGIAIKTPHMKISLKELVEQADKAMYTAKRSGKNKTVIYKWFKVNDLKNVH